MSWIDDYLNYTSSQESPPLFHKWCSASIIAATVNRRVWLDRRDQRGIVYFTDYPGQLSVCLVAGAGRCKKSTAVNFAKPFMRQAGVDVFDGKITPEALLGEMAAKPKPVLTVIASELSAFLSKASYNDGLIDNLIKLLDCDSNPYKTKKGTFPLDNPCLTLLMATTPYSMGKSIPPQAHDTGFLSRHIFVFSDQPGSAQPLANNEADIDPALVKRSDNERTNLLLYLRRLSNLDGPFKWTKRGQTWYNDHYSRYSANPANHGDGYPQRRPIHLTRLAMCLHLASKPDLTLDEPDLVLADKWLTEVEVDMPKAFAHIGRSANSEQQERVIAVFKERSKATGAKHPTLDGEELYHAVARFFNRPQDLLDTVNMLTNAGILADMGRINNKRVWAMMKEPY